MFYELTIFATMRYPALGLAVEELPPKPHDLTARKRNLYEMAAPTQARVRGNAIVTHCIRQFIMEENARRRLARNKSTLSFTRCYCFCHNLRRPCVVLPKWRL